jgi:pyridoxal phosphate enzyme (YggS family)
MIAEELRKIKAGLPKEVTLIAVSKYHPNEDVMEAYNAGQRIFGENIVQELRQKQQDLPKDIQWHFIGHLQKNKIKYIAPFVAMIHSVDSFDLLQEINKHAAKVGRVIPCLLQIHVAKEETKFGFTFDECREMLRSNEWRALANVHIEGLMCMASNVPDEAQIAREFSEVNDFFKEVKAGYFKDDAAFCHRSWGMSHDYPIAIQNGSTMVRLGTCIFGSRPKK